MSETLISTPTKCKLCDHVFSSDLLRDAAIVGSDPQAKLQQVDALMKPLMKHMQKRHPEALQQAQIAGATFAGYLLMTHFEMDAETHQKLGSDLTRWKIRQMMTRQETRISDERLDERLTAILDKRFNNHQFHSTTADVQRTLLYEDMIALLKQLRDVLEERGRYTEPTQT